jgi:hypothetical protein
MKRQAAKRRRRSPYRFGATVPKRCAYRPCAAQRSLQVPWRLLAVMSRDAAERLGNGRFTAIHRRLILVKF